MNYFGTLDPISVRIGVTLHIDEPKTEVITGTTGVKERGHGSDTFDRVDLLEDLIDRDDEVSSITVLV